MRTPAPKGCYSLYATHCKRLLGLNQNPWHKSLRSDSWSDICSSTKPAPHISAAPARAVETASRDTGPASTTNSAEDLTLPNYTRFVTGKNPQFEQKPTWRKMDIRRSCKLSCKDLINSYVPCFTSPTWASRFAAASSHKWFTVSKTHCCLRTKVKWKVQ